jgi:cytochrome c556
MRSALLFPQSVLARVLMQSALSKRAAGASAIVATVLLGPFAILQLARADDAGVEQIIENRQANYHDLGAAVKNIKDLLESSAPSMVELRGYAQSVDDIAHYQETQDWFPRGSGPEAGVKTKAKPEIWAKPDEFQKWRKTLPIEADKLLALVTSHATIAALKAQHHALGEACAGCHKVYREKED